MCQHPAVKLFTWHAMNIVTGKKDWLCIGCQACGEIIKGSTEEYEAYLQRYETNNKE